MLRLITILAVLLCPWIAQARNIMAPTSTGGGGPITIQNHGACLGSQSSVFVTSTTCGTVTVSATNDLVIWLNSGCDGGSCGGSPVMPVLTALSYTAGTGGGAGGTCQLATGTQVTAAVQVGTEIWYCKGISTSGTVTFSFTWGGGAGTGANFPRMMWIDASGASVTAPDQGIGQIATGTSTSGTPFSVSTNGALSAANELVVGTCIVNSSAAPTSSQTILDTGNGSSIQNLDAYFATSPGSGTTPSLSCTLSLSSAYSMSIAAFKS